MDNISVTDLMLLSCSVQISDTADITKNDSQGTVLSPSLLTLYTSDFCPECLSCDREAENRGLCSGVETANWP